MPRWGKNAYMSAALRQEECYINRLIALYLKDILYVCRIIDLLAPESVSNYIENNRRVVHLSGLKTRLRKRDVASVVRWAVSPGTRSLGQKRIAHTR